MLWTALLIVSVLATSPLSDAFQLKHSWYAVPNGWERYAAAPPDHILNLRIGLKVCQHSPRRIS